MSKIYDGIMGLVVGDALGVPFEFKERDTFEATDMVGYGTYNQPPGTWSDDSSMTLATMESVVNMGGRIVPEDIMKRFVSWFTSGTYTPHGKVFDIGNTTKNAIVKYMFKGFPAKKCGGVDKMDNGNGSLMRILPLAFAGCSKRDVNDVSSITHRHEISINMCDLYVSIAQQLISGEEIHNAINNAGNRSGWKQLTFDIPSEISRMRREEIKSTGFVVDTMEAALWCLLNSSSYKECVLMAVNLGGDTDTIAAVAGGLAGIHYGVGGSKGIPAEWIDQIARKDWIKNLCDQFEKAVQL